MRYKFFRFFVYIFFLIPSCTTTSTTYFKHTDLFDNNKDAEISSYKKIQNDLLTPDSAYYKSNLVIIATPLATDSIVSNNAYKVYLNAVQPIKIIKGLCNQHQPLYFISNTIPTFTLHDSGWVMYLEPLKQAKLLGSKNIQWQWLSNAPFHKTL